MAMKFICRSAWQRGISVFVPRTIPIQKKRHFVLSTCYKKSWLDARDPDKEEKDKQLVIRQGNVFDEAAKKARDKATFDEAVNKYLRKQEKYRRGSVEFIYAALTYMEEFGVHKDLDTYKKLISVLPKHVMIAKTMWQVEMQHYPKQQQCIIDLLDKMESYGKNFFLTIGQLFLVYDLRVPNLRFVAPMPEQIGNPTMHFHEVSGGTYQKFLSPKLGELDQIDVFQYRM